MPTTAVVYHGQYYRSNGKCGDFFKAAYNHKSMIIDPLLAMPMNVFVVFHTYTSGCESRDRALVDFLRPVAHEIAPCCLPRIVDSYIRALQLLQSSRQSVDWIVLTRFELMLIEVHPHPQSPRSSDLRSPVLSSRACFLPSSRTPPAHQKVHT